MSPDPVLALQGVTLIHDGQPVLEDIDWAVRPGERWVVLGRNGSGKTSLLRIASLYTHPTRGEVNVLGERLGRFDVRRMRVHIGLASSALAGQLRGNLSALDIVMTAKNAALEPWWHIYSDDDRAKARNLLERLGVGHFATRAFATLSSGEQQRVQLARTLMSEPAVVLLDEPTAGLDLAGREELVGRLAELAGDARTPPFVLVTHHVDEIPPGFTHVLMLNTGRITASGPLDTTMTSASLSSCFGLALELNRHNGRFSAWAL
ncbi:MAG: ATP-binding cassette domain-containing protein [Acidimicrobiales bacterium]